VKFRTDTEEAHYLIGEKGWVIFSPDWEHNQDAKMWHALKKIAGEVGTKSLTARLATSLPGMGTMADW
jgi:hypothetical protein